MAKLEVVPLQFVKGGNRNCLAVFLIADAHRCRRFFGIDCECTFDGGHILDRNRDRFALELDAQTAGINVPKKAMDQAIKYVWDCQDLKGNGGFRYQKLDGPAGFARSAAALSALHQAGVKEKKEELEKGLAYLRAFKPRPNQERAEPLFFHHYYGQYYAAQAMRSSGDKDWRPWYPAIRDDLLASRKDNHWPDTISPHYGTAIALIILQMPMNDLPKKNP